MENRAQRARRIRQATPQGCHRRRPRRCSDHHDRGGRVAGIEVTVARPVGFDEHLTAGAPSRSRLHRGRRRALAAGCPLSRESVVAAAPASPFSGASPRRGLARPSPPSTPPPAPSPPRHPRRPRPRRRRRGHRTLHLRLRGWITQHGRHRPVLPLRLPAAPGGAGAVVGHLPQPRSDLAVATVTPAAGAFDHRLPGRRVRRHHLPAGGAGHRRRHPLHHRGQPPGPGPLPGGRGRRRHRSTPSVARSARPARPPRPPTTSR